MITTSSVLATGANTVPFELREKLCKAYCINSSIQPSVTTEWSVDSSETIGTATYYTLKCITTATYKPKGSCANCGYVTNTFIDTIVFAVGSGFTITLTSSADAYTTPDSVSESNCNVAHAIKHYGSLVLTVAAV